MTCGPKSKASLLLLAAGLLFLVPSYSVYGMEESTTAQELTNLPPTPTPKLPDSAPLTLRLAETLQSWVTWYKVDLTQWHQKLIASFQNLSDSFKRQIAQQEKTIEAKDAVIFAQNIEIESLRQELKIAQTANIVFASGLGVSVVVNFAQAWKK